ncbi:RNA polymerase sigma factor [Marinoscillum furvescens]|uniref:RNA polymerase sigma-70 factor (ECF subfamily) n=1 Tax=Marinoscillum furvescens DSM 4134 TaxID=1122208 RepID=A0A3D9L0X9_MARFU|nr:sigma-70 family RNA polymerase sigma factor [Marinoscillum furvescens]RED93870.1 RNA polymerase sigma-70 factor (ECF subfamily) [Marinoscillum furvescens DSM 4134]
MTEQEFIHHIQQHLGIIQKIVYLYCDDPIDREDLTQEIQLQAWRAVDKFKGASKFSTWLYRVALNTALTYRRKLKPPLSSLEAQKNLRYTPTESSDRAELLMRAIRQLSDINKTIITLHLEDFDNGEIAEILGMTPNNVGVKLHRIKQQLSKKLKECTWTN